MHTGSVTGQIALRIGEIQKGRSVRRHGSYGNSGVSKTRQKAGMGDRLGSVSQYRQSEVKSTDKIETKPDRYTDQSRSIRNAQNCRQNTNKTLQGLEGTYTLE